MLDRHQLTSDLLTDYALGLLTPGEEAEVEAALDLYPQARQETNIYLDGLSDMVMALEPSPVPEGAADRLMARLNAELAVPEADHTQQNLAFVPVAPGLQQAAPVRRNWLYPLLAVAAVAVIGVAVLPGVLNPAPSFASYQARPGAVTSTINDKAGAAVAQVVRLPDGHAYVQMQASVPAGRAYQAWKIEGGKPVSLGLFKDQAYLASLPAGTVFAVTVEPAGGSPQPTTTPLFAQAI
ncbi:anti-sigma factor domain-containing protein [Deinococcus altitudinis]|uniref:anti-sigma factor n=1 Tax=Deinococcus altitudinis TaxID=468914 RepID=UPI003892991B